VELAQKNILVVGLGKSGQAAARFAARQKAHVTVTDLNAADQLTEFLPGLEDRGIHLVLGEHPVEIFKQAALIVVSPGVPHTIAPLELARQAGVPVLGELEFAARFVREPVVAITGTNGKTTTTALVGDMLEHSGKRVFVGGNIGNPLIDYVAGGGGADLVVLEVSSFQLDTASTFHANVAVLLNISADHLDRYDDFAAYVRSKGRIFQNQVKADTAVINRMDPEIKKLAGTSLARVWPFLHAGRNGSPPDTGAEILTDRVVLHTGGDPLVLDLQGAPLTGAHNRENIAAAALAALAAGGTAEGIQQAVQQFHGLAHRLETVATINGVLYVDDSKGTNVDAVSRALEAFSRPTVLIMGGRDKGGDYAVLKPQLEKTVKRLVVMGEAATAIAAQLGAVAPVETAVDMTQAVRLAAAAADPGDVVLLSPACSSFDMYDSFAQRGEDFCKQVGALE